MKYIARTALGAILCITGSVAQAAAIDLSKPFICATVEALDCGAGNGCKKGIPDDVGAPNFMRIDLQKKVVAGPKHTSPIRFVEKSAEQTLLQGTELGFAWTLVLDPQGKMTATMASASGAFMLFGSCTTL